MRDKTDWRNAGFDGVERESRGAKETEQPKSVCERRNSLEKNILVKFI